MAVALNTTQIAEWRGSHLAVPPLPQLATKSTRRTDIKKVFRILSQAKIDLIQAERALDQAVGNHRFACAKVKDAYSATQNQAAIYQVMCQRNLELAAARMDNAAKAVYSAQDGVAQLALVKNHWTLGARQDYKACAFDIRLARQGGQMIDALCVSLSKSTKAVSDARAIAQDAYEDLPDLNGSRTRWSTD